MWQRGTWVAFWMLHGMAWPLAYTLRSIASPVRMALTANARKSASRIHAHYRAHKLTTWRHLHIDALLKSRRGPLHNMAVSNHTGWCLDERQEYKVRKNSRVKRSRDQRGSCTLWRAEDRHELILPWNLRREHDPTGSFTVDPGASRTLEE